MDRLKTWSAYAELVAAVSVVITLGLLIIEVRDNTSAIRAQTYQQLMSDLNDWRFLFADPEFGPEWTRVQAKRAEVGLAELTEEERMVLYVPSTIRWGIYESAYFANRRGILGEQEWERFAGAICRAYESDAEFWEGRAPDMPLRSLQTPGFVAFVERTC